MSYEKPRARPGLICWYVRWNPDGTVREARYRKPERQTAPEVDVPATPRRRSIVAVETRGAGAPAQGALL